MNSFKKRYLVTIVTIFALLVSTQFMIQSILKRRKQDSVTINLGGRQRMLSQKLAKTVLTMDRFQNDPYYYNEYKSTLLALLQTWSNVHHSLQQGKMHSKKSIKNSPQIDSLFQIINPHFDSMHQAILQISQLERGVSIENQLTAIMHHESSFLMGMDDIVFQYERESSERVERLANIEWILSLSTIILLILEIGVIFYPLYHRLIKQQKRLESLNDDLKKEQEKIQEMSQAKEEFLSHMSHELRTPLNAVIGVSHLMMGDEVRPEQRENLEVLYASANHLLSLVNDVLDFAKIESGAIEFETIDFDIRATIREIEKIYALNARQKSLYFKVEIDPKVPNGVVGDQIRLKQILTNLVNNAIKFTDKGGIIVHVKCLDSDEPQHVLLQISVTDTGIGIPADKLAHIFDTFTQAESHTTRKYGGSGLGLAITQKLVLSQGGNIEVRSTYGEGSTFTFNLILPISARLDTYCAPTETTLNDLPISPSFKGMRILIAEDDRFNQFVMRKLMDKWELSYQIVSNGREVLDALMAEEPFDLVLMDFEMPEMGGLEATERIRSFSDPYFQNLPIIALTASAIATVKEQVLSYGMNGFTPKPIAPEELKALIHQYAQDKI